MRFLACAFVFAIPLACGGSATDGTGSTGPGEAFAGRAGSAGSPTAQGGGGGAGTAGAGALGGASGQGSTGVGGTQSFCDTTCLGGKIVSPGNNCGGTTDFIDCGNQTCVPAGQTCPGASGAGGGTSALVCAAGEDCVPGEWCGQTGGADDFCACPTTKPKDPVTLQCGKEYPFGESAFVCYDPAGAACLVPGPDVIKLVEPRMPTNCASLVSAGANELPTAGAKATRCCYTFQFFGCK